MMSDWGGMGWWGMGFGIVFMLLFWALVILGIAALLLLVFLPVDLAARVAAGYRTGVDHARQQRSGHDPAGGGDRSDHPPSGHPAAHRRCAAGDAQVRRPALMAK